MIRIRSSRGFTLIELLIVVAIIGIIAAIAIPGLLRARMAGNESSAIGSLRAVNSSQQAYASSCANGSYAISLSDLGIPPAPGQMGFISPDLSGAASVIKSGYTVTIGAGTPASAAAVLPACNGVALANLVGSYYATAIPLSGSQGYRHFWTNTLGTIYSAFDASLDAIDVGTARPTPTATSLQ